MLLSLWSLNLMDDMRIQAVIPLAFAFGLFVTQILFRLRDMAVPLWFGRSLLKWGGMSVLSMVFVGYGQLQRGFYTDDQRKVFMNYQ